MQRAAVLIGVSRTGGLDPLQAVESGVGIMERWARAQGLADDAVIRLTDNGAETVTAKRIKDAVKQLCDRANVEQLILYFAGHGVNLRFGEYWLLSHAPDDTQEAVNLAGSVELARHCGIAHVIVISDACRTSASGIGAQNVTGSEVFPNVRNPGAEYPVDIFFAATLGHESFEVKDPGAASANYRAVFTESLVAALSGQYPELLEWSGESDDEFALVRPRPLKRFLRRDVQQRLRDAHVAVTVFQEPDARITSDDDAWISRLPAGPGIRRPAPTDLSMPGEAGSEGEVSGRVDGTWSEAEPEHHGDTLRETSQKLLHVSLGVAPPSMPGAEAGAEMPPEFAAIKQIQARADTSGAADEAGFIVRGAKVVGAESWRASVAPTSSEYVAVNDIQGRAADILLTFDSGSSVVLPAIRDFVGVLTFAEGELLDVALSPTPGSARIHDYEVVEADLRGLRAVIAASARLGVFRLEGEEPDVLAHQMRVAEGLDPTLALYASYAYKDLGLHGRIRQVHDQLELGLGIALFDVAMLSGALDDSSPQLDSNVFPSTPLLSQGWATLRARKVRLHPAYDGIEAHLLPSLWTLLDGQGAAAARSALQSPVFNIDLNARTDTQEET